jgi:hypothetical protein
MASVSPSTSRLATTALLAGAALSLVAAATTAQARATTLYACVKKNGDAHIYTKRHKCKKGETTLSWNNAGPVGKSGAPGARGETGARGEGAAAGEQGATGEPGPAATLWAVVATNGKLVRGGPDAIVASELAHPGEYEVVFDVNVSQCAYIATLGSPETLLALPGIVTVATRLGNPHAVYVETFNLEGKRAAGPFHLAVFC